MFGFLLVVLGLISVALRQRRRWVIRHLDAPDVREGNYNDEVPSRLILPDLYEGAAFGLVVLTTLMAIAVEASKLRNGGSEPFVEPYPVASSLITGVLLIGVPVMLLLSPTLRGALAIMTDVVDHFVKPPKGAPIAEQRRRRFDETLEKVAPLSETTNLLVVAHSQGTVVVLDAIRKALRDGSWKDRIGQLRILTLGSPIQHIYEHYFQHLYPPLSPGEVESKEFPTDLRWLNVYRSDDYVGRELRAQEKFGPENLQLPTPGGHTRYWEEDVFPYLNRKRPDFFPG